LLLILTANNISKSFIPDWGIGLMIILPFCKRYPWSRPWKLPGLAWSGFLTWT
jgi:hypothetical protein